jgi:hypothetical protein
MGILELQLGQEPSGKCGVQIRRQICSGDKQTLERFHLFQEFVFEGTANLIATLIFHSSPPLSYPPSSAPPSKVRMHDESLIPISK